MGTRRSKHNKGRKRLFARDWASLDQRKAERDQRKAERDALIAATDLTAPIPYFPGANNQLLNMRRHWTDAEKARLVTLLGAGHSPAVVEAALGRPISTIRDKMSTEHIRLPKGWRAVRPRKEKIYVPKIRAAKYQPMAFPYIAKSLGSEHDMILAVNALIPKSLPEHIRADICQDALMAIYEGSVTLEELQSDKRSASFFIRKYYRENVDRNTVSLSGHDDDNRSYDERASSMFFANEDDAASMRGAFGAIRTHTHATQEEDVFEAEVDRIGERLAADGKFFSRAHLKTVLASGGEL